ncbi:acyltransferase [Bradyrhizobium sp.]|jgi:acetyltransferase-like isoleucine patch superfamily enzyme|uniref:acyltransferase n=1 Tax=Bradyrhizobium sp. TaxID=376 RepID=UPI002DFE1D0E|nr:acyltransferase [Bradyrhizobium sp.]
MSASTPIESGNVLLEKQTPLTAADKKLFAYFGVDAKILPPFRILNPQNIVIGDVTAIREGCHINAFADLSFLINYIDPRYRQDFERSGYIYKSRIEIGRENQIGRFAFLSCTSSITLEDNVLVSERVYIGDNNHGFSHPQVPIMQQPNGRGQPITIGKGSWIGAGAAVLMGTRVGRNSVIGANSVCRGGDYPSHSVIGPDSAKLLYRRFENNE